MNETQLPSDFGKMPDGTIAKCPLEDTCLAALRARVAELEAERVRKLEADGKLVAHRMLAVQRCLDKGGDVGCVMACPSHRCDVRPWACERAAQALAHPREEP